MNEPLYGATPSAPIWTGIPSIGFGFPQTAFPFGNVPIAAGVPGFGPPQPSSVGLSNPLEAPPSMFGFMPQTYGFSQGAMSQPPSLGFGPMPAVSGAPVLPNAAGALGGFPGFVSPEIPFGVNIPHLVAVVAMRRRQPQGPTNDQDVEDFIYDALELLPGTSEVEVRCEGGRITLTGGVQHKRLKRDVGEIAWTIPGTNDVQNNVTIATRRRARGRDADTASTAGGRKQA
jgi:hypothetical protein